VTPKSVDSRDTVRFVTFTARMFDPQSNVGDVVAEGSRDTSWLSPETGTISFHKVEGTQHLYQARVPVSRWAGTRTWQTSAVWAWNSAQGSHAHGLPHRISPGSPVPARPATGPGARYALALNPEHHLGIRTWPEPHCVRRRVKCGSAVEHANLDDPVPIVVPVLTPSPASVSGIHAAPG
jgi:hypothetical protein